jgi:predicted kinase
VSIFFGARVYFRKMSGSWTSWAGGGDAQTVGVGYLIRMSANDIQAVYASLNLSPRVQGRPSAFVLMTGLPGCGKSYLSRILCERHPFTWLGSDPVRAALIEQPQYTPSENSRVYEAVDALVWRLAREGRDVLYDAANLSESRRWGLRILALDAGARALTVHIVAPPEVIQERLRLRMRQKIPRGESEADWAVYQKLLPRAEPVQHQHLRVDSTQDLEPAIAEVLNWVHG